MASLPGVALVVLPTAFLVHRPHSRCLACFASLPVFVCAPTYGIICLSVSTRGRGLVLGDSVCAAPACQHQPLPLIFPPRSCDSSSAMGLYMAGQNETKGQAAAEAAARGRGTIRRTGSGGASAAAVTGRREPTTGRRIRSGTSTQHQSSGSSQSHQSGGRLIGGKEGGSTAAATGGGGGVSAAQVIHQKVTSLRAQVRGIFEWGGEISGIAAWKERHCVGGKVIRRGILVFERGMESDTIGFNRLTLSDS